MGKKIIGTVQSGIKNPIALNNYLVKLYRTDKDNVTILGEVYSDKNGQFKIELCKKTCADYESILYLTACYANIKLLYIVDNNFLKNIIINEITTLCGIYSFSQFYNGKHIIGNYSSLNTASLMYKNLATWNGDYSKVILSNPNGNETNTLQSINSLSNLLASCINSASIYNKLVALTTGKSANSLNCFHYIARNPSKNINGIYELTLSDTVYDNILLAIPDSFTLAVKVNSTGNNKYLFGGVGNIVFDKFGNAVMTTNVVQGTTGSSNFAVILKPNGQSTKESTIFGGGLLGGGFGLDIDKKNNIWLGNLGWGGVNPTPSGSVTKLDAGTNALSPDADKKGTGGFQTDIYRVQGIVVDNDNNVWMASNGNNRIVVYLKGDPTNSIFLQLPNNSKPFSTSLDYENYVIISLLGDANTNVPSGLLKLYLKNNKIKQYFNIELGDKLLGTAVDTHNNIFVCSNSESIVYKVDKKGNVIKQIKNGGISYPWGCFIDGNNNLLVANFDVGKNKIYGIAYFDNRGHPISPDTGYTLPTGGTQVLMANGEPLYGYGKQACYKPLMKQTGINVDCAGNVWVCNNWKPDFEVDVSSNPGGDGIVIFVGLASPVIL